jgi:hypothetical protein
MTKIPIKTRLPVEAWAVAAIVTLFSLLSAGAHQSGPDGTPATAHASSAGISLIR